MSKPNLFRRELFGFSRSDVNEYISSQNAKIRELAAALQSLEQRFEANRRFYEALMRVHDDNLSVLREVQTRATRNENAVRALGEVFISLSAAYRDLYAVAAAQQEALALAKVYETKACKYDDLARQMKELVLPSAMQEEIPRLASLPQLAVLPDLSEAEKLADRAEGALEELLSDAKVFFGAGMRLQSPKRPDDSTSSAG